MEELRLSIMPHHYFGFVAVSYKTLWCEMETSAADGFIVGRSCKGSSLAYLQIDMCWAEAHNCPTAR